MLDICDRAKMSKILLNIMSNTKVLFFTILSFFIFSISSCDVVRDVLNQGVQDNASCIPPLRSSPFTHDPNKSISFIEVSISLVKRLRLSSNLGKVKDLEDGIPPRKMSVSQNYQ